jgi:FKBP-type peptidyl-prolyl cis-trans isomerase FkpA
MKRFACLVVLALFACASGPVLADAEPKTEDEKTLYALGLVISRQLSAFHLTPAELGMIQAGLADGSTAGKTPKVDLDVYGPKIQAFGQARVDATIAEAKKKGKEYVDKAAAKPGIKKLGNGALVETVTEGTGASPAPTDTVKISYKGTLLDGTVVDSSEKRGGPQTMRLDQVVKCWQEGVTYMKVGGKAKFICPAESAYGDRPMGAIPPGSTLLFDIELVDIVKPEAAATPATP